MKILHLNSLYHPQAVGGAEKSLQTLAESQLEQRHSVAVVTLTPGESYVGEVNGVKVYYVGLKNLYWPFGKERASAFHKSLWHALDSFNPAMQGAVEAVLRAEKPDIVHSHNLTGFSASAWRAAARQKRPVVHTLRDYSLLCPRATMFAQGRNCASQHLSCRAYSAPRKALSRHLNAVTAISRFIMERHVAAGSFSSVPIREVIYNPFPTIPETTAPGRPAKVFTFGFIGQLSPAKGLELLLRAFSKLNDNACELVIAGQGEPAYERALRVQAEGKNVRFLGVSRPADFYPTIDALVVPSLWHEPFGRVIVEAYAYGVPVLASARGGIPEIVEHLETGFLFNPDDTEALYQGLRLFLSDQTLRQRLVVSGRSKMKQFLPKVVCAQYDAVYSRVTG